MIKHICYSSSDTDAYNQNYLYNSFFQFISNPPYIYYLIFYSFTIKKAAYVTLLPPFSLLAYHNKLYLSLLTIFSLQVYYIFFHKLMPRLKFFKIFFDSVALTIFYCFFCILYLCSSFYKKFYHIKISILNCSR